MDANYELTYGGQNMEEFLRTNYELTYGGQKMVIGMPYTGKVTSASKPLPGNNARLRVHQISLILV